MGEEIDGAMQQAPQPGRQFIAVGAARAIPADGGPARRRAVGRGEAACGSALTRRTLAGLSERGGGD
jgi:hypothetical protein